MAGPTELRIIEPGPSELTRRRPRMVAKPRPEPQTADLADPMVLLSKMAALAEKARAFGWTVNLAIEAAAGGGRLNFSASREG